MSWTVTLLSDWTSAGGRPLADLGPALEGTTVRRELSGRVVGTVVLTSSIAWPLVRERSIVRIDRATPGDYLELRIVNRARRTHGVQATRATYGGEGRLYDFANSDLVREVLGGRTIYRFNENLPPRQYLDRFFAVRLVADRLVGVRIGVVEFLDPIPLQWDRWTRGQLLTAIVAATGAELQLRIATDGAEELDLLREIGAAAPVLPLFYGGQLRDHAIDEDFGDLMTVARVAGEAPTPESERATIGENLWRVDAVRLVGGVHACALRAPDSGESPILEDGQYVANAALQLPARYLASVDGSAPQEIVASWVATGEVGVSGPPPAVGSRVQIVADADGNPLETLELPSAIEVSGYVVRDLQIAGGRGERQYARNGGHEDGIAEWSSVNGGLGAEYRRTELGATVSARANGLRPAGTGTGTPFAIDGLQPGSFVRQGMSLEVGGVTLTITADAIPSPLGALTLALGGGGLPGDYPDGSAFQLVRRDVRTLLLDGAQSPLSPNLQFRDSTTDGLYQSASGTVSAGVYAGPFSGTSYVDTPLQAGRARLHTGDGTTERGSLTWPTYTDDVYVLDEAVLAFTVGEATGTVTYSGATIAPVVGTRLRYFGSNSRFQLLRVTAITGGVLSVTTESGAPIVIRGPGVVEACNLLIADGTAFTVTELRETRTLFTNGPHTAGATTVAFKPQANIATRHWVATDTISLRRTLTGMLDITAVGAITPLTYYDEERDLDVTYGYELVCTFAAATSTMDDIALSDWPVGGLYFQTGGSKPWRLEAISGTDARFFVPSPAPFGEALPVGLVSATWTVTDTYALTGTATWSANGRVTLALAGAVPAGRSYARGFPVWSNWHPFPTNSLLSLHAALNAGAATVELRGVDAFTASTSPLASARYALYRVWASASTLPVPGNLLFAAATTQANGAGQANVVLTAANGNTIADNALVTISSPPLLPVRESRAGSALRLFCAVGGATGEPLPTTLGQRHSLFYVRVPAGSTRQLTVRSLFTLSAGEWFPGQGPVVAIVDALGAILGWSALGEDGIAVEVEPGEVDLTTRAIVAASGLYGIRVYGGGTDYRRWCMHLRSMVYVGEALDAPYTPESHSTPLMLAALRRLAQQSQPRIGDRLEVAEIHRALAPSLNVPAGLLPQITLGGRVHLEDWDRRVRITAIEERPDQPVAAIEVGQLARDGAQLLGAAALAAGVRRIR